MRSWSLYYIVAASLTVTSTLAAFQEAWWNITYVENVNPDGLYPRRVIGVNGSWPPPLVSLGSEDYYVLHVLNSLDVPTTLHHHGIYFNSTSWMDGAAGVSQCGIPPGQTFDYLVPINTSTQWGTYWVHSHYSGQYVDGLRSAVTLHPPQEVYTYDEEFTVMLGDWYHLEHEVLLQSYFNLANPGGAEPIPDSGLIYFAQNQTYLPPIAGTSPTGASAATGFNENTTLPFEPGKTYRLRIVNMSGFAAFYFWIDGHDMQIIEVDGVDIEATPIDLISITVAQRYSVLVTARNDTSSNWAIHANMDTVMFDTVPPALNPNVTSSVTYNSSAPITNYGTGAAYHDVNDTALVPIIPEPLPEATKTIQFWFGFATMNDGTNHAIINDTTYNSPLVPAVLSEMTLGANATVQQAYGPLSFVVNHLDVVDIVIQNTDTGKHPFHLHGHKPQIAGRTIQFNSTDPSLNPPVIEGQLNPMRRDTFQLQPGGSIALRFVADNPGVWFLHCHIEWHLQAGLAMQLIEAPLEAQARANVPQAMYDQCTAVGLPNSGNAAGHASTTDLSGLPLGPYVQNLGWHAKGIVAMTGCVLTALIGMLTVMWYPLGGHITEEELEHEVTAAIEAKETRRRLFGLLPPKKRQ